ncbi:16S rRNA (uracil(1498)-N(3))-methyltransferase [Noviherbaspirillum aerium]|uniref:16S rRNA (uracil(1498)-N(3))-methyltransferase n=1 Tax=Noviherbaspirillum aerium TaxID=2588497 RepID=UPI00124F0B17|nr:16S rRNA (uracil(1498)-N(3))-methyltransferase [Noviherbaspirillum aerium]
MPRFFLSQPLAIGGLVELPDSISHHVHVLRLEAGDMVTLFNGEGGEYTATISSIEKRRTLAEVKTFSPRESELPYAVTLAQGLPEGSKMDWIVEKAVELGATAIQPIAAQRSVVRLNAERAEKKLLHWRGIIEAAAEQCGRNRVPHMCAPVSFSDWVGRQDLHQRILLSPRAGQSLSDWARHHPPQAVSLMVGPEGGFTEQEESIAADHGVLLLSIGKRVLRTETAGLAALAGINALWGEI